MKPKSYFFSHTSKKYESDKNKRKHLLITQLQWLRLEIGPKLTWATSTFLYNISWPSLRRIIISLEVPYGGICRCHFVAFNKYSMKYYFQ